MTDDKIEVRMKPNINCSWVAVRCGVCGIGYNLNNVNARSKEHGIDVCPECIRSGDIDARLHQSMAAIEAAAQADVARLRDLIGRLKVPTWSEWQAAYREVEMESYRAADWPEEKIEKLLAEATANGRSLYEQLKACAG